MESFNRFWPQYGIFLQLLIKIKLEQVKEAISTDNVFLLAVLFTW